MSNGQAITVDVTPEDLVLGFPIVRPGTYNCQITGVEVGQSKTGKEMATIKFTPQGKVPCGVEDPATGENKTVELEGREFLKSVCVFQGNCARQTLQLQVATRTPNVGFRKGSDGKYAFYPEEFVQFKGKMVKVVVENEDYEGRPQARVKSLFPA